MNDTDTMAKIVNYDWIRADAMTEAQIHPAALVDSDARPLMDTGMTRTSQVPRARTLRRALGLMQRGFATRYQIPLATLRDWEQGRAKPDQRARAYLRAIAGDPAVVRRH